MDNRKKEKIENDKLLKSNPTKALLYEIERLNDNILSLSEEVKKKEQLEFELSGIDFKGKKGEDGYTPIKTIDYFTEEEINEIKQTAKPIKGIDYFTEQEIINIKEALKPVKGVDYFDGLPGESGKDAEPIDEQKVIKEILDRIPDPIPGKQGEQGRPPKHEILMNQIRFENPDGTWGNWIRLGSTTVERGRSRTLHRGGLDYFVEDLSSQCNGVNMVFTTTEVYKQGTVYLSSTQFPIVYRKDIDFLETGQKEITLVAAQVGAPQTDQTLMVQYIKS